MLSRKELLLLSELRNNARETLTEISKRTKIPVSTIFDKLKMFTGNLITNHTTLLNFNELGFNTRANVMIRVEREAREDVKDYLSKHPNINSVMKINNGFDFMFEAIFISIKEMEEFIEQIDKKYKIIDQKVFYIVEDIKKESFLTDPQLINLLVKDSV